MKELIKRLPATSIQEEKMDKPMQQVVHQPTETTIDHYPLMDDTSATSSEKSSLIFRGQPSTFLTDVNVNSHNRWTNNDVGVNSHNGWTNRGDRY